MCPSALMTPIVSGRVCCCSICVGLVVHVLDCARHAANWLYLLCVTRSIVYVANVGKVISSIVAVELA